MRIAAANPSGLDAGLIEGVARVLRRPVREFLTVPKRVREPASTAKKQDAF